ncbi:MAG: DUF3574 domain-containing protein [Alphaproteobacteria bacterium]|nr:DUF3574 domain-containing protein [Alphaproteobacteria bacterium]
MARSRLAVRRWLALAAVAPLVACTAPDPCRDVGAHQALVATLLFGLDVPGRRPVTNDEWAAFMRDVVTPRFPEGLTVLDGNGQWRDPATGRINAAPSRVVIIATDDARSAPGKLAQVADAYKARFDQKSVGILISPSCAAF